MFTAVLATLVLGQTLDRTDFNVLGPKPVQQTPVMPRPVTR